MSTSETRPGWARWLRPFLVLIGALAAGTLLMAPMVNMDPRALPIAVVNLDAGTDSTAEQIQSGSDVAESVTQDDRDGMISWQTLSSQEELDQALEDNEVYAALVIPANFSASQADLLAEAEAAAQQAGQEAAEQAMQEALAQGVNPEAAQQAAQQAAQEAAETAAQQAAADGADSITALTMIVNQGKNPMVTGQLAGSLDDITGDSDIQIQTEYYNEIPAGITQLATFLPMVLMILAYISGYAGGIGIRSAFPLGKMGRGKTIAIQLGLAAVASVVAGFSAAFILAALVPDANLAVGEAGTFLSIAVFALMSLVLGSINWAGMVGMFVPVGILLLGLGTANLPYEFLPSFWQDWIYPWNPLRFLAEGGRAVLYQGAGWWNAATLGLAITCLVGAALTATSALTPRGRKPVRRETSKSRENNPDLKDAVEANDAHRTEQRTERTR